MIMDVQQCKYASHRSDLIPKEATPLKSKKESFLYYIWVIEHVSQILEREKKEVGKEIQLIVLEDLILTPRGVVLPVHGVQTQL